MGTSLGVYELNHECYSYFKTRLHSYYVCFCFTL